MLQPPITTKLILETAKRDPAAAHRMVAQYTESIGGHRALFEFRGKQSCIQRAITKPLPGAAGDAFLRGAVKLEGFTIYEVMPIHHKALQAVNSPLLDLVGGALDAEGKTARREFEPEDERQICYIFTAYPKDLFKVPKSELAAHIKAKSEEIFEAASSADINAICNAVLAQYHRHIQTSVKRQAQLEGQVEPSFFQELKAAASKPAA
jgi:hypothetical protein